MIFICDKKKKEKNWLSYNKVGLQSYIYYHVIGIIYSVIRE